MSPSMLQQAVWSCLDQETIVSAMAPSVDCLLLFFFVFLQGGGKRTVWRGKKKEINKEELSTVAATNLVSWAERGLVGLAGGVWFP